jgi:hypothetical protein
MTSNEKLRQFYQTDFITEVLKDDYLLHCILALSAFHLVEQNEELLKTAIDEQRPQYQSKFEEYLTAAHTHYNASICSFRRSLANITPENCHALFVCSSILFVTSVVESGHSLKWNNTCNSTQRVPHSGFSLIKWLPLLRGAKAVALERETLGRVLTGPMARMFATKDFSGLASRERWERNLIYLETLSTSFRENSGAKVSGICISATDLLRKFMKEKVDEPETAVAFMWALEVDPVFINLLECETSEALLVFASYCALLHSQSWRWWIKDWPANTIRVIEPMLGDQWRGMLEWPLRTTEENSAENRPQPILQYTNTPGPVHES